MAKSPKKRRTKRSGILVGLGLVFAASIIVRIGTLDISFVSIAQASDPEAVSSVVGPTAPIRAALDEVAALRDRLAVFHSCALNQSQSLIQLFLKTAVTPEFFPDVTNLSKDLFEPSA